MNDYAKMRLNMVDGQLRTNGITAPEVIAAFTAVPREQYLSGDLKASAYVDDALPLPGGGFLMEPLVFARLVQGIGLRPDHNVFIVGDMTGYAAAILSHLAARVVEMKPGAAIEGPFDSMIVTGAVADVPDDWLELLAPGGRLAAVIRPDERKNGALTVIEKDGQGVYSHRRLFDSAAPYLPGFEPTVSFKF